jgi:hypothetical protein
MDVSWKYAVTIMPSHFTQEGWVSPRSRSQRCGQETEILPMPGIEPRQPGCLARSPVAIVTALCRSTSQNALIWQIQTASIHRREQWNSLTPSYSSPDSLDITTVTNCLMYHRCIFLFLIFFTFPRYSDVQRAGSCGVPFPVRARYSASIQICSVLLPASSTMSTQAPS